jgi:pimeloyl-ACP methyl ester carboxylesterase
MNETPSLLLVHGAWHGPWCWERLLPELHRAGLDASTVALPSVGDSGPGLGTIADDAAAIAAAAAALEGDVVVVAHSDGGVATTEGRLGPNVRHLIYLGAFMPDVGQSLVDLLPPGPLPPFVVTNEDGTTSVHPAHAVATFYADCDPATAAWAVSKLRRHNAINNVTPVSRASWREIPSTFIILAEDFACPTPVQRATHHRASDWREMQTSHSPFLSRPAELALMLREIVAAHAGNGMR